MPRDNHNRVQNLPGDEQMMPVIIGTKEKKEMKFEGSKHFYNPR